MLVQRCRANLVFRYVAQLVVFEEMMQSITEWIGFLQEHVEVSEPRCL